MQIGPFKVENRIGRGGMAFVHRAVWTGGVREVPVAVKFLVGNDSEDADVVFPREARNAARLSHPNVVTLLDCGHTRESGIVEVDTPFLVMEYVDGPSLAVEGPTSWEDLRKAIHDIALGLAHAHAHGVLHRDVKPGNVLRADDGRYRLVDFGVARIVDDGTDRSMHGRVVGTPNYMAPEQIIGNWRDEGPWTDIYALGALAWRLLTRKPLYSGSTVDVLAAHVREPLPDLEPQFDVPVEFEKWLRRSLEKLPEDRFRSAASAAHALLDSAGLAQTREYRALQPGGLRTAIPEEWPTDDRPISTELRAAGAGLFGMRQPPLSGREREKEVLWQALRRVDADNRPRVVSIHGDSGSGKSALAQWLVRRVQENGYAHVVRSSHEQDVSASAGLEGAIADWFRIRGLPREKAFDRLQSALAHYGFKEAPLVAMDIMERLMPSDSYRRGLAKTEDWYAFLATFLRRLAGEGFGSEPVVWVMDDVQWGPQTIDFVRWLEEEVPVLFLLTDRRDAADADPTSLEGLETIRLGPLQPAELREFTRNLLTVAPDVEEVVVRRAEGSPLFASQLIGDWVARDMLQPSPVGYQVDPSEMSNLPESVHAVWQQRLATALGDREAPRRALEAAAVLGAEFETSEWRTLCELTETRAAVELLDDLTASGLTLETDVGHRFTHTLLRESILRGTTDLARLHRAAAAAIEKNSPATGRRFERVARHFHSAGDRDSALEKLVQAMAQYWHEEQYDAVAVLSSMLQEWAADADMLDSPHYALGLVYYGGVLRFRSARGGQAQPMFEQALEIIGGENGVQQLLTRPHPVASQVAFRAHCELAIASYRSQSSNTLALEHYRTALAVAEAAELHSEAGIGAVLMASVLIDQEELVEAERAVERGRKKLELADRWMTSFGMSAEIQTSKIAEARGDRTTAIAGAGRALEIAETIGKPLSIAIVRARLGELAWRLGRFDEARAAMSTAIDLYKRSGAVTGELVDIHLLIYDILHDGTEERHLRRASRHLEAWRERGVARGVVLSRMCLAICEAGRGQSGVARQHFRRAIEETGRQVIPDVAALSVLLAEHATDDVRTEVVDYVGHHRSVLSDYFANRLDALVSPN